MDRRQFLVLTGSGAAAAAVTAWMGCSQRVHRSDSARLGPVEPRGEKPLLALVVLPEEDERGRLRAEIVGGALNHGGDALLADLASVDLVCVTPDRLPPEARSLGEPPPWFVLLTRDGGKVTARAYAPGVVLARTEGGVVYGEAFEKMAAEARARVEAFAADLHAFLLPVVGDPGNERASRAAEARRRYVDAPPPGSHWAQHTGCGVLVEGVREQGPTFACGMGQVPEVARRFLDFYVKS